MWIKKRRTHLLIDKTGTKRIVIIFKKTFWKIFEKPFIQDQSQICISNGLKVTALQREALICEKNIFI